MSFNVEWAINELRHYDKDFLIGILLAYIMEFEHLELDTMLNLAQLKTLARIEQMYSEYPLRS